MKPSLGGILARLAHHHEARRDGQRSFPGPEAPLPRSGQTKGSAWSPSCILQSLDETPPVLFHDRLSGPRRPSMGAGAEAARARAGWIRTGSAAAGANGRGRRSRGGCLACAGRQPGHWHGSRASRAGGRHRAAWRRVGGTARGRSRSGCGRSSGCLGPVAGVDASAGAGYPARGGSAPGPGQSRSPASSRFRSAADDHPCSDGAGDTSRDYRPHRSRAGAIGRSFARGRQRRRGCSARGSPAPKRSWPTPRSAPKSPVPY